MSKRLPISHTHACFFCGAYAPLRESHIIPQFVYKWFKRSSGTGFMRSSELPNRRTQDGIKMELLCEACEQRFNQWETVFRNQFFVPYHENKAQRLSYGPWLMKFSVSVCWRALTYLNLQGLKSKLPGKLPSEVDRALETWKAFLLDQRSHPNRFEQHMLLVGMIGKTSDPSVPPNMNQYLLRSVDLNSAHADSLAYVYVKMCRIILLGFIAMPDARRWKGTKVHVKSGVMGQQEYVVPLGFMEYVKSRARKVHELQKGLTPRQRDVIEETYQRNLQRAFQSESMQVLDHDVMMFGDAAFADNPVKKP